MNKNNIKALIRDYKNFPVEGITFKDISPILSDPKAFAFSIDSMSSLINDTEYDSIICIDARGFIFGSALAYKNNKGIILARKSGKLPGILENEKYDYEYASTDISIQKDAISSNMRYLIVDDVLATGNTALTVTNIVAKLNGNITGVIFFAELEELRGRQLMSQNTSLQSDNIFSFIKL